MWLMQAQKLKDDLLALGPKKLIMLSLVGLGVAGGVAGTAYIAGRSDVEPLYVGLSAADVGRIGAVLRESGVSFDVSADGTKVLVRRSQSPNARMLLAERGLPAGGTSGYEIFDKVGPLGLTSFMQEVTRTRAVEGELARTIQLMRGVKSARVHLAVPEGGQFRRTRSVASASVVIRLEGPRDQSVAPMIRNLVSAAVPGLSVDNVSITSSDGTLLAAAGDVASAKTLELEQSVSRQLSENVRRTLAPYLGVENFEVTVPPRLNLDKKQISEQVYDPETKSERSTRVVKESGASQNAANRSAVTVEQNVPTEAAPNASGEQSRKSNERREELTNYELSSKNVVTTSGSYKVELLTVAVVVNRKRLLEGGSTKIEAAELDRRLKEIETISASAAGIDAKRGDQINVVAVNFLSVAADAQAKPGWIEVIAVHLDTLILAITLIAATLIFVWIGLVPAVRSVMAGTRSAEPALEGPLQMATALPESDGLPMAMAGMGQDEPALVPGKANGLEKKLEDLIARDEKQVADLMKQWLVSA